LTTPLKSSF